MSVAQDSIVAPGWWAEVTRELETCLAVPRNWDGYDAAAVSPSAVPSARELLIRHASAVTPRPHVAPAASGGIILEWHTQGIDLDVEAPPGGSVQAYFRNATTGDEWDFSGAEAAAGVSQGLAG